ncbi:MAG: AAA domain-containing protein [Rhodobacteraceae bacterium]|nr:AAA domain-containing protein [Paracoccaceae bacterium]
MDVTSSQKLTAEARFKDELALLKKNDPDLKPAGWLLSPRAVRKFILGDAALGISQKFYGDNPLVDRCIVALMGHQGLMLVGEPGTAKTLLSELLSAAISGDSLLVVQGSAGIIEDHLRYGWNYAVLLAEGPSERAMVASPVMAAMQQGKIARIEELTRCAPEVQDALISLMSEKTISTPELGSGTEVRAARGFNLIGTANLRDLGVNEMSSALKRRFNFETVQPISDPVFEQELVAQQVSERMAEYDIGQQMPDDVLALLVSVFRDLRTGQTHDGAVVAQTKSVMSTAEAVNVGHAAMLDAAFLDGASAVTPAHIARHLGGVVFKDEDDDVRKFRAYIDTIARARSRKSKAWKLFFKSAKTGLDG